jgi:microcystin-dependent protein
MKIRWLLCLVIGISPLSLKFATAQAYEPFIGEIQFVAFNFPPSGWASCDGSLLQISQNTALFSLLGTTYGGDGITTFALPNLQSRVPVGMGQGVGLTNRVIGQTGGQEDLWLTGVSDQGFLADAWGSRDFMLPTMPPFLTLNCIISLSGVFPSRGNAPRTSSHGGHGNTYQSLPEVPSRNPANDRIQGMSTAQMSVLIEAIKGFQTQAQSQRAEIRRLKAELEGLKAKLNTQ